LFPFSQDIRDWTWTEYFETMEILGGKHDVDPNEVDRAIEALRKKLNIKDENEEKDRLG
jgi:hypothetical protein